MKRIEVNKKQPLLFAHGSRRFLSHLKKAQDISKTQGLKQLIKVGLKKVFPQQSKTLTKAIHASQNTPKTSIIIPVYNAVEYTNACISSIYSVRCNISFEIIVVDNNSTDKTQEVMAGLSNKHTNIRYVRLDTNKGFSGAVNIGITAAVGNYIVLLNNDTIVSDYWLDRLIDGIKADNKIGIISAVTNYIGEGPQLDPLAADICVDQINFWSDHIKDRQISFQPSRLVFFCCLIKRSIIDKIGLLDEQYLVGNYEDDDFCLRTVMAGHKLAIANNSFVYHYGSKTFEKNRIDHTDRMLTNRDRFFRKSGRIAVSATISKMLTVAPTISVIVRTVNRPQMLYRTLTSLSNQTFHQFEVVLVNDNGPDLSNIVEKFEGLLNITYLPQSASVGRTQAINLGLEKSKGKWLSFLDDDDIFYPWHLATFADAINSQEEATFFYSDYNQAIFSNADDEDPLIIRGMIPWDFDRNALMIRNYVPINTWLMNRALSTKVGPFDQTMDLMEDYEYLLRLSRETEFIHIKKTTCEYRFYLDGINSMINQREKTLSALEYIYSKYSIYNQTTIENRRVELITLEKQIRQIKQLKQGLSDDKENTKHIIKQIAQLILGY